MILKTVKGYPAPEFAGRVLRVLAHETTKDVDPVLMLDFFDSKEKNLPEGSWHPHRGIETFTYITRGKMREKDTLNGELEVDAGGVLHLSAGSGIYHTGLPTVSENGIQGFQFWFNLPQEDKMGKPFTEAFQNKEFPHLKTDDYDMKFLVGTYKGVIAPLQKPKLELTMIDVTVEKSISLHRSKERQGFIFVYEGNGTLNNEKIESQKAYILDEGDLIITGKLKFIFIEGKPLNEPIAWRGPIVMNTHEELMQAFKELNDGTFIKEDL